MKPNHIFRGHLQTRTKAQEQACLFSVGPSIWIVEKDNETNTSYRVTVLLFRVYIALEKFVFRRTNKKTMHIPRKTYFLVEELEKKAVVEPAPAVWHNLQFGARPPAVSKYQRIKKCLPLYFCISLIMYFSFCTLSCTTCIFGPQTNRSKEISTDQKFIPRRKVWKSSRAKAKHCDGRNPTISRRHNLNFQTSNGNNIMGRDEIFSCSQQL